MKTNLDLAEETLKKKVPYHARVVLHSNLLTLIIHCQINCNWVTEIHCTKD